MDAAGEAEFRSFVAARWHRLLRLAYLLTGDHERAVELVESTLVRAHRRWRRITRAEDPDIYALRTLVAMRISRFREVVSLIERATGRVAARSAGPRTDTASGTTGETREGSAGATGEGSSGATVEGRPGPTGVRGPGATGERMPSETPERPSPETPEGMAEGPEADSAQQRIWERLAGLRPRARAVLVLRHYEDFAEDEVADLLGCSVAAVRREESRGLERLRAVSREAPSDSDAAADDRPGSTS